MERHLNNAVDFDAKRELIKIEAEGIAKRHGLDLGLIISIYEHCPDFDIIAPVPVPFETNLDRAIAIMGKEKALELFESEDPFKLAERVSLVDHFNLSDYLPLYSLDELAHVTQEFIQYLLNNRRHLLNTGYPSTGFNRSPWLDKQLSNLYHFKFPKGIEGPPREDRARLKNTRGKLFDLKVIVLKELLRSIKPPRFASPWEKCLALLTKAIPAEEAEFYLHMDHFYLGYDVRETTTPEEIPGLDPAGGLTELLETIGYYEEELFIGTYAKTRDALGHLFEFNEINRPRLFIRNYFEALDHPLRDVLNSALDLFSSFQSKEMVFWKNYRDRVNQALNNDFYEEVSGEKVKRKFVDLFTPHMRTLSRLVNLYLEATGKLPLISIPQPGDTQPNQEFVFRKENDFWALIFKGGKCSRLKDEKGLRYIAHLLNHPDEKIHVMRLYHMDKVNNNSATTDYRKMSKDELAKEGLVISRLGHGGTKLDRKATAQYKNHLKELREECDEAERNNDIGRKERIGLAIQKIKQELADGIGRGGSLRKEVDPNNEKARKAVGNCIKRSLKQIEKADSNLWHHLYPNIHTGNFCSYTPDRSILWEISYHA